MPATAIPGTGEALPAAPTVTCLFLNTQPLGCDPQQLLRCLQSYVDHFVGPYWGVGCTLKAGPAAGKDWAIVFADDADQAGVLGYHDLTPAGMPLGHVFVKTSAAEGDPISVVASHELAEMLVDPTCNQAAFSPRNRWVALEPNDPVQGDVFNCGGLPVSNFVTPAWFGGPGGGPFDHMGLCKEPWEIRPGGYALVQSAGSGEWTQVFGSTSASRAFQKKDRRLRRAARICTRRAGGFPAPLFGLA